MSTIIVNSDGGARGNPGPAGIGCVIKLDKQTEISEYIGEATNNQAEYKAVIAALEWIDDNVGGKTDLNIQFFLDSQLVVEQLNQRYKLKNEGLKPLFWQIRELVIKLGGQVSFMYIPREKNKEADRLVNQAIDKHDKHDKHLKNT